MGDRLTRTLILAAVLVAGSGMAAVWLLPKLQGDRFAGCGEGQVTGDIGGPFTLVSETGETVTDTEALDIPSLVYFGYTFCPDVCPLDAVRNAEAVDLLEEAGHEVRPVFVSVDPARDTPQVLAEFTDAMHPRMLGLTGSEAQVAAAAEAYRVYYRLNEPEGDPFYLVDHSTFTYLVLPGEGFVTFFRREATPERMAEVTSCFVERAGL